MYTMARRSGANFQLTANKQVFCLHADKMLLILNIYCFHAKNTILFLHFTHSCPHPPKKNTTPLDLYLYHNVIYRQVNTHDEKNV